MKKYLVVAVTLIVALAGATIVYGRHHKPAITAKPTEGTYVALGDSVAAGAGLKDDSDSSACDRTNQSYPNQVAASLNLKLTNLSCSKATIPAGILGPQDVNNLAVPSQLSQLFALPKPTLVTLTIGANDADWVGIIGECYTGTCGSAADTDAVNARLAMVSANLRSILSQIQTHYGASLPHIVVTGYHQVFPASPVSCPDLTGIDGSELAWGRQQQSSLNDTIKTALSAYSFVHFAPVDFSGHELCATDSWVQSIGSTQPYHPTEAGQAAFATSIEAAFKSAE